MIDVVIGDLEEEEAGNGMDVDRLYVESSSVCASAWGNSQT